MVKNLITCLSGSRSYGLETETSDFDYRSVHFEESLLKNLEIFHKDKALNLEGDDSVSWDLCHFLKMTIKGNTQALEILFADEDNIKEADDRFLDLVIKNREEFLDTEALFSSTLGYMKGEGNAALESKGKTGYKRGEEIKKYGYSPKNFVQFLRLSFCFSYFLKNGIFPIKIKKFSKEKHEQLMDIKRNPVNYVRADIERLIEDEKKNVLNVFESRDKSLDKKINLDYLENVCEVFLGINNRIMNISNDWSQYKRKGVSEMRPYRGGEDMTGVSISEADLKNGSPKVGDMIARNPKDHSDQWLVAKKYFEDNFEPV